MSRRSRARRSITRQSTPLPFLATDAPGIDRVSTSISSVARIGSADGSSSSGESARGVRPTIVTIAENSPDSSVGNAVCFPRAST